MLGSKRVPSVEELKEAAEREHGKEYAEEVMEDDAKDIKV